MSLSVPAKAFWRYVRRVLKVTDQFGNVVTGGDLNETISARAARLRNKGVLYGCVMCQFLNLFQRNHCDLALDAHLSTARITVQDAVEAAGHQ